MAFLHIPVSPRLPCAPTALHRQAPHRQAPHRTAQRQRGAIAVMAAASVLLLLGMCGLALDVAQIYNRRMELQAIADAAALAAAAQLDGTPDGVRNAVARARAIVEEGNRTLRVRYNHTKVRLTDAAISFSATPALDGSWTSAVPATNNDLLYVKVDTAELDEAYGQVDGLFIQVLAPALARSGVSTRAVAGRSSIKVAPIAVCAMSDSPGRRRDNPAFGDAPANVELVQFGFRRGVSYDLMQLNPNGTTGEHFIVDPVTPPGRLGVAANVAGAAVAPFLCSGTMGVPRVSGGDITVSRPFPLAALYQTFNSRFGDYTGALCESDGAPPDVNVKQYPHTAIGWMTNTIDGQSARSLTSGNRLHTVADPDPVPGGNKPSEYGPLWAYARAVQFASFEAGKPESPSGYSTLPTSAWAALYRQDKSTAKSYPSGSGTPYATSNGNHFEAAPADHAPGVRQRRVLNVLLLTCPVPAGELVQARVAGIGKFFMTVPATSTTLIGEFGGLAWEGALGGPVELLQ